MGVADAKWFLEKTGSTFDWPNPNGAVAVIFLMQPLSSRRPKVNFHDKNRFSGL